MPHPDEERDRLREAMRRALELRTGNDPSARAVAGATQSTWLQVACQLAPVIGDRGVEALFSRSLQLTSAAYPWLGMIGKQGANPAPLSTFIARLEAYEPCAAASASHAVLVTFTELLTLLIGTRVSERLLAPLWATRTPAES